MNEQISAYLATLSGNTLSSYRSDLALLREIATGTALTTVNLRTYLARLSQRGFAASTLNRKTAALRSFCKWLGEDAPQGWRICLPTGTVEAPPPVSLTEAQIAALLAHPRTARTSGRQRRVHGDTREDYRDVALLRLLVTTGLRINEAIALDVTDVGAGVVRIKGTHPREVPLDLWTDTALDEYLIRRPESWPALFANHRGERLTRHGAWLVVKDHAKAVGLPWVSPSQLRHTAALAMMNARPDYAVAAVLGHVNVATTRTMYAKRPSKKRAA